jgi:RND family efflux transporter MFP subunit
LRRRTVIGITWRSPAVIRRIVIVLVVVAALVALLIYSQHRPRADHISGFIEADDIRVGSRVGGRVAKVQAVEGATVKVGDTLVELEPYDLLAKQAQVNAQLEAARAGVQLAKLTYERIKSPYQAQAASPAELETAEAELKRALAEEDLRKHELEQIAIQIGELTIRCPANGIIEAVDLQPGDLVAANAPVLSLLDASNYWVRAYLPENHLNVQTDDKVSVTVDSYPGRRFAAHVSFIARQAEFTPNNVQTPEERSKQVFRIKVTLDEGLDVLRPGMAADVWLNK